MGHVRADRTPHVHTARRTRVTVASRKWEESGIWNLQSLSDVTHHSISRHLVACVEQFMGKSQTPGQSLRGGWHDCQLAALVADASEARFPKSEKALV